MIIIIKIMMITILTNLGVCALWSPTEPSRVGATDFEKLETSNASSSCSTGATSDQISDRGGFWTLFNEQDKKSKSIFNPATLKTQNDEWLFFHHRPPCHAASHPPFNWTGCKKSATFSFTFPFTVRAILGLLLVNTDRKRVLTSMLPHGPNARDSARTLK